jgi:hypothetical protein
MADMKKQKQKSIMVYNALYKTRYVTFSYHVNLPYLTETKADPDSGGAPNARKSWTRISVECHIPDLKGFF